MLLTTAADRKHHARDFLHIGTSTTYWWVATAAWQAGQLLAIPTAAWQAGQLLAIPTAAWQAGQLLTIQTAAWEAGQLLTIQTAAWQAGQLLTIQTAAQQAGQLLTIPTVAGSGCYVLCTTYTAHATQRHTVIQLSGSVMRLIWTMLSNRTHLSAKKLKIQLEADPSSNWQTVDCYSTKGRKKA